MIPHSRPWLLPEDTVAVQEALRGFAVCHWRHAEELSVALARYAGAAACRLYGSGTLALRRALCDLRLPPASGVGIPAFTCADVLRAVIAAGCRPVILDCDARGLLCVEETEQALKQGLIRAAVCVHQFGLVHRALAPLASAMPIVEDCSHVPPRFYLEDSVAAIGSMEGTKLLGAGEGGYLLCRERPSPTPDGLDVGQRMSDLLAVLAQKQLGRLERNLERRAELAARWRRCSPAGAVVDGERGAWFRFLLCLPLRETADCMLQEGQAAGISLKRPIMPHPLHRLQTSPSFRCPTADRLWERCVSVPVYPGLSSDEVHVIDRFLAGWLAHARGNTA